MNPDQVDPQRWLYFHYFRYLNLALLIFYSLSLTLVSQPHFSVQNLTVAEAEAAEEVEFAAVVALVVDAVVAVIAAAVNGVAGHPCDPWAVLHPESYLCLGNFAVVKLAVAAFAAVVVALWAVAVVVAAVVAPAVAADLARKAVGTLRKTQEEEHCDGAAVAVSEDMVEAVVAAVVVESAAP